MSAPSSRSLIRARSSSAASRPTSGFAPAPRPLVSLCPSWTRRDDKFARKACASVLATMNSTPSIPAAIIVLTALLPPPPTPTTLIFATCSTFSSNSNIMTPSVIAVSAASPWLRTFKLWVLCPLFRKTLRTIPSYVVQRDRTGSPGRSQNSGSACCGCHTSQGLRRLHRSVN